MHHIYVQPAQRSVVSDQKQNATEWFEQQMQRLLTRNMYQHIDGWICYRTIFMALLSTRFVSLTRYKFIQRGPIKYG